MGSRQQTAFFVPLAAFEFAIIIKLKCTPGQFVNFILPVDETDKNFQSLAAYDITDCIYSDWLVEPPKVEVVECAKRLDCKSTLYVLFM